MGGAKKQTSKKGKGLEKGPKKEEPKKEIAKSVATSVVEPKIMEQMKKEILPKIASGKAIVTMALTEPSAGYSADCVELTKEAALRSPEGSPQIIRICFSAISGLG
jgi:hypothetical protein